LPSLPRVMSFGPPIPARAEEVAGGREYLDALVSPIGRAELAVSADRDTVRQVEVALGLARYTPRPDEKRQQLAPLSGASR
jgi:hypothetical protein